MQKAQSSDHCGEKNQGNKREKRKEKKTSEQLYVSVTKKSSQLTHHNGANLKTTKQGKLQHVNVPLLLLLIHKRKYFH